MASGHGTNLFRPYPYTSIALLLAFTVLLAAMFSDIDVFELPSIEIVGVQQREAGEVAIAFLFILPAFFIDRIVAKQQSHETHLRAEQLRVLDVTIRTVQDIVNNNMNQLYLLRFEAEGHVTDETLSIFDNAFKDTAAQLTALASMKVFAEKPMAIGPFLDVSAKG